MPGFYVKEYARNRWHVIAPSGLPVYDDARNGDDKPLVFTDEDDALAFAERCNQNEEDEPWTRRKT